MYSDVLKYLYKLVNYLYEVMGHYLLYDLATCSLYTYTEPILHKEQNIQPNIQGMNIEMHIQPNTFNAHARGGTLDDLDSNDPILYYITHTQVVGKVRL